MDSLRLVLLLIVTSIAGSCGSVALTPSQAMLRDDHLIAFRPSGHPIVPNAVLNGWELGDLSPVDDHFLQQVRHVMKSARQFLVDRPGLQGADPAKILVFIHGGLNTYEDSIHRVLDLAPGMMRDGYYPIFVSWDSGLVSSYLDNLIYGEGSAETVMKITLSPLVVVRDLVAGVLNIPARLVSWIGDNLQGNSLRLGSAASAAKALELIQRPVDAVPLRAMRPEGRPTGSLPVEDSGLPSLGQLRDGISDRLLSRRLPQLASLPEFAPGGFGDYYRYGEWSSPKILLAPVGIATSLLADAFGKGMWQGMLRRIKRLFDQKNWLQLAHDQHSRGLSLLMSELRSLQGGLQQAKNGEFVSNRTQSGLEILSGAIGRMLRALRDPRYDAESAALLKAVGKLPSVLGRPSRLLASVKLLARQLPPDPGSAGQESSGFQAVLDFLWLSVSLGLEPQDLQEFSSAMDVMVDFIERGLRENLPLIQTVLESRGLWAASTEGKTLSLTKDDLIELLTFLRFRVEQRLGELRAKEVEVDVFAHSMGAIIVNEILRRSDSFPTPHFKNIVYLAAACSIKDYEDAVFPYLYRHRGYRVSGTNFYSLMLHPLAEVTDNIFYDILPRGSLLVYIDDYLSTPATTRDRTLGRFENIMLSLKRTRREVASRIHLKVLPAGAAARHAGEGARVENHVDFTPSRFWHRHFYWSDPSNRD